MRFRASLLIFTFVSLGCLGSETTGQVSLPRDSAFGFLLAHDYNSAKQFLPDEVQDQLKDVEPEVLNEIFSIAVQAATKMGGKPTNISGPTKEGELKIAFGPASWLQFQLQQESSSDKKAVEDFAIRFFKDGTEVIESPFASRLVFNMDLQSGTWRIGRMTVTGPVNIFDKRIFENLSHAVISRNESSAVGAIRWINLTEVSFATKYPKLGFTCDPTKIASFLPASEAESTRTTVLKDGLKDGYRFKFGNCDRKGEAYQFSAEPIRPSRSGNRSFCSDESGIIYFSISGSADTCLKEKNPI